MTRYKISEIGEVVSGGTPSTKYKEYYSTNKDISWITPKDLSGYTKMYISNGERYITSKGLNNSSAKMLPKDTILISSRAPIGYVAIAQKELATNQGFKSIIPDKTKILPEFLYFTMITKKSELENIATGSTFKEVSGKVMKNFEIDVPTIEKQKQIIDKLIPIVRKIELNNEINTNLFELANIIFQQSFNCNGNIPLSHYFLPKRGKNLLKKNVEPGAVPVVAGGLKPAAYHNISNTETPVITISASGANAGYVQIWGQKVWSSDSSYIDSSITDNIYFWYIFLKSRQKQIFDAQTGSAQPHIYPKHIGNLLISELDEEQVQSFNKKVTPIFEKIFQNQRNNSVMEDVKNSLLYKFFNDY